MAINWVLQYHRKSWSWKRRSIPTRAAMPVIDFGLGAFKQCLFIYPRTMQLQIVFLLFKRILFYWCCGFSFWAPFIELEWKGRVRLFPVDKQIINIHKQLAFKSIRKLAKFSPITPGIWIPILSRLRNLRQGRPKSEGSNWVGAHTPIKESLLMVKGAIIELYKGN